MRTSLVNATQAHLDRRQDFLPGHEVGGARQLPRLQGAQPHARQPLQGPLQGALHI